MIVFKRPKRPANHLVLKISRAIHRSNLARELLPDTKMFRAPRHLIPQPNQARSHTRHRALARFSSALNMQVNAPRQVETPFDRSTNQRNFLKHNHALRLLQSSFQAPVAMCGIYHSTFAFRWSTRVNLTQTRNHPQLIHIKANRTSAELSVFSFRIGIIETGRRVTKGAASRGPFYFQPGQKTSRKNLKNRMKSMICAAMTNMKTKQNQ